MRVMAAAGLILTGGASRRMGRPKAAMRIAPVTIRHSAPETLAERTARLLESATRPTLEIGPGFTHLTVVREPQPGRGPLAAVAAGATALRQLGWPGPVVVVATDFPLVTLELLTWLASQPDGPAVVPMVAGRPQPLCARYGPGDLDLVLALHQGGQSSMHALLDAVEVRPVHEDEWGPIAGEPNALRDVDSPDDLQSMGWAVVE